MASPPGATNRAVLERGLMYVVCCTELIPLDGDAAKYPMDIPVDRLMYLLQPIACQDRETSFERLGLAYRLYVSQVCVWNNHGTKKQIPQFLASIYSTLLATHDHNYFFFSPPCNRFNPRSRNEASVSLSHLHAELNACYIHVLSLRLEVVHFKYPSTYTR